MENNQLSRQNTSDLQSSNFYTKITDPIDAIKVMGEMIAGSGMFGCTKVEQGMVLAMQCLAEGKAPLEMAKTYHIVEGKLTMRADAMLGRYLTSGGKVKWTERSDTRVAGIWICDGNEIEIAVTIEDMKKNGVAMGKSGIKDNWRKFPRQMLTARCISEAIRLLMPQIISGIYTPEEVQDFASNSQPAVKQVPIQQQNVVEVVDNPNEQLQGRLDELLLKYEPRASNYLIGKGYLSNGQTYRDLDAMTAQRLLASPAKMINALEATK